jgi:hypothetical protein
MQVLQVLHVNVNNALGLVMDILNIYKFKVTNTTMF